MKRKKGRPKKPNNLKKILDKEANFSDLYPIINEYVTDMKDRLEDEFVPVIERVHIEQFFKLQVFEQNLLILKTELKTGKEVAKALQAEDLQDQITYATMQAKKTLKEKCLRRLSRLLKSKS